jgi:hypothetical protein
MIDHRHEYEHDDDEQHDSCMPPPGQDRRRRRLFLWMLLWWSASDLNTIVLTAEDPSSRHEHSAVVLDDGRYRPKAPGGRDTAPPRGSGLGRCHFCQEGPVNSSPAKGMTKCGQGQPAAEAFCWWVIGSEPSIPPNAAAAASASAAAAAAAAASKSTWTGRHAAPFPTPGYRGAASMGRLQEQQEQQQL